MVYSLILLFLHSIPQGNFLFESNTNFVLKNDLFEVHISKSTNTISSIVYKNKNLLDDGKSATIRIQSNVDSGKIVEVKSEDRFPDFARVYFRREYPDKAIEYQYTLDSLALRWDIEILSKTHIEQELCIDFEIPILRAMKHIFCPSFDTPTIIQSDMQKEFTYRSNIFLPILTTYNDEDDYGMSMLTPLDIPKPSLSFSVNQEKVIVSFNHLRLPKEDNSRAAIFLIPHSGDWRPGLNSLLKKYPAYLYPKCMKTKAGEGWYSQSNPHDDELVINRTAERHVKWTELHYYFPFYGLYAPDVENWGLIANSDTVSLLDWEQGAGKTRSSYRQVRDLINLWHKRDIQVYLYFQSFEAWHQYAKQDFARDITRDRKGNPCPAWKFCNLLNPDPSGTWGKYVLNQAKSIIEKYPDIDGIFYDRLDYWNYDFAHDDGLTMVNDKYAYMLSFGLERLDDIIFDIIHKNKKGIWGNGPTSIEVCKNLDGIMAEGDVRNLYKLQYLGLVRPIVYLAYDKKPKDTESKLKNSLLCGAFPSITYGDTVCQNLDKKYAPLFNLIKNREWVLSSNPIVTPADYRSNIFRTPDSDYVVVVVSPEKSQLTSHPFEYNIPITVNIPDAVTLNYVYLLSGDWQGINFLDFVRESTTISINVPYHLSISLLYLTRENKFAVTRLSSPVLVSGESENTMFHIDSMTNDNQPTVETNVPWLQGTRNITPHDIHITIPKNINGEVSTIINYKGQTRPFSYWVVDPVSIAPMEDIFILNNRGDDIPFYLVNNLERDVTVYLQGQLKTGNGSILVPQKIDMKPLESKKINCSVATQSDGVLQFTLSLGGTNIVKSFPVKSGLAFSNNDLFHDDFTNGLSQWTINTGEWQVSNGVAQGSGPVHFAFVNSNTWQDYVFETKTQCHGSSDPAVDWLKTYVYFRLQDDKNFYRFGIHGDAGVVDLYKRVDGKWTALGSSPFMPKRDKWYALRVSVKGSQIIGYVNGEKIIEANDNAFGSGGIGIGVLEDAMICDYKDVVVKKL